MPLQATQPNVSFTPSSISGLCYWWVADDVTNQSSVTTWPDRIQANNLFQPTNTVRPLTTTDSVLIDGRTGNLTFLNVTNLFFDQGATNSFWMIVIPLYRGSGTQQGSFMGDSLGNNYEEMDATTANAFTWYVRNGITSLSGRTILFSNLTTLSWSAKKDGTGNGTTYTNGVQAIATVGSGLFTIDQIGRRSRSVPNQNLDFFGRLYQLAVWTNTTLTSVNESNLYWFATNYSGAVP